MRELKKAAERELKLQSLFSNCMHLFDHLNDVSEGVPLTLKAEHGRLSRAERVIGKNSTLSRQKVTTLAEFNYMKQYMIRYASVLDSVRRDNTQKGRALIAVDNDIKCMFDNSLACELRNN